MKNDSIGKTIRMTIGLEYFIIMLNKQKREEMVGNFKITSAGDVVVELRKRNLFSRTAGTAFRFPLL